MNAGVGPVSRSTDPAVLHRIEMDVVHMPFEIGVVTDQVFPVAPLPKSSLALQGAARADALALRDSSRETLLDEHDARGEVGFFSGQRHQQVQVLVQEGRDWRTARKLSGSAAMCSVSTRPLRSAAFNVKK